MTEQDLRVPSFAELGFRLQWVRENLGLSLKEVAKRTGCSGSTITRIEDGRGAEVATGIFLGVCKALEIKPDHLLKPTTVSTDDGGDDSDAE